MKHHERPQCSPLKPLNVRDAAAAKNTEASLDAYRSAYKNEISRNLAHVYSRHQRVIAKLVKTDACAALKHLHVLSALLSSESPFAVEAADVPPELVISYYFLLFQTHLHLMAGNVEHYVGKPALMDKLCDAIGGEVLQRLIAKCPAREKRYRQNEQKTIAGFVKLSAFMAKRSSLFGAVHARFEQLMSRFDLFEQLTQNVEPNLHLVPEVCLHRPQTARFVLDYGLANQCRDAVRAALPFLESQSDIERAKDALKQKDGLEKLQTLVENIFSVDLDELQPAAASPQYTRLMERLYHDGFYTLANELTPAADLDSVLLKCKAQLANLETDSVPSLLSQAGAIMKKLNSEGALNDRDLFEWKLLQLEYYVKMRDPEKLQAKITEVEKLLSSKPHFSLSANGAIEDKLSNLFIMARFLLCTAEADYPQQTVLSLKNAKLAIKVLVLILKKLPQTSLNKVPFVLRLLEAYYKASLYAKHLGLLRDALRFREELCTLNNLFASPVVNCKVSHNLVWQGQLSGDDVEQKTTLNYLTTRALRAKCEAFTKGKDQFDALVMAKQGRDPLLLASIRNDAPEIELELAVAHRPFQFLDFPLSQRQQLIRSLALAYTDVRDSPRDVNKLVGAKEIALQFLHQKYLSQLEVAQCRDLFATLSLAVHLLSQQSQMKRGGESVYIDLFNLSEYTRKQSLVALKECYRTSEKQNELLPDRETAPMEPAPALPDEWAYVAIDVCPITDRLQFLTMDRQPTLQRFAIDFAQVMRKVEAIIAQSDKFVRETVTSNIKTKEERKEWWRTRFSLDIQLGELISSVDDCVSLAFPDKKHLLLSPGKGCASFPWESLDSLRSRSVSRIPSLSVLRLMQAQAWKTTPVFHIVNPNNDLPRTGQRFESLQQLPGSSGYFGHAPPEPEFIAKLFESNFFIYMGHGGCDQYVRPSELLKRMHQERKTLPPALLIGCASTLVQNHHRYEPLLNVHAWLAGGSPMVLGMLWDVTDTDIDDFSREILDRCVKGPKSVTEAVSAARNVCRLRYLNGAAPVVHGLPLHFTE